MTCDTRRVAAHLHRQRVAAVLPDHVEDHADLLDVPLERMGVEGHGGEPDARVGLRHGVRLGRGRLDRPHHVQLVLGLFGAGGAALGALLPLLAAWAVNLPWFPFQGRGNFSRPSKRSLGHVRHQD